MNRTVVLMVILAAAGVGCNPPDTDDEMEQDSLSAVEQKMAPPADSGCSADDEYYYETTSYTSSQTYLWHCVGYDSWGNYTECDTYQVCKVQNIYANVGLCVDDLLYGYKYLKSSTTVPPCANVSYSVSGGACPVPLYSGFCY